MRTIIQISLFAALLLAVVGCSSQPKWEARLEVADKLTTGQGQGQEQVLPMKLTITENGKPAKGIAVHGVLEMKRMDHGSVMAHFHETGEGVYEASPTISMGGDWVADIEMQRGKNKQKVTLDFKAPGAVTGTPSAVTGTPVATVQGEAVTQEELDFYALLYRIPAAAVPKVGAAAPGSQAAPDKNGLLTEVIRLRAMALLAKEKGHSVTKEEAAGELEQLRKQTDALSDAQKKLIADYGADQFWSRQEERLSLALLDRKVRRDVEEAIRKDNPSMADKEVQFQTSKKYEELLVSQMGTLKIVIY